MHSVFKRHTAKRSDAISRLDTLISSKGDYFSCLPFHMYLYPSALLHPDAPIPRSSFLTRIGSHAVMWPALIPVILLGALIVTVVSVGFPLLFQLDALRLSALRCSVISERREISLRNTDRSVAQSFPYVCRVTMQNNNKFRAQVSLTDARVV